MSLKPRASPSDSDCDMLTASDELVRDDGWLTTESLLGWALTSSATLALPSISSDIAGSGTPAGNGSAAVGGTLIWLWVAWRLRKNRHMAWPTALLRGAMPFTPLLLFWPVRTLPFWVIDPDLRLLVFSLILSLALGLMAYHVWPGQSRLTARHWPGLVVTTAATAYVAVFSLKSLIVYNGFYTGGSTPAGFDQALWNGAHWFGSGEPLTHFMSSSMCCDSILSDHAFLIFVLLLPVYAVGIGGPEFLMITQSVATALAAVALYLLGRKRLGTIPAALIGLAYLAFFINQRTSSGDFRADAFVAPLLLFAWYAFTQRRVKLYCGLVVLALACKEEVAFVVIALGIYLSLFERAPRIGIATIVLATAWFALDDMVIMPYFGSSATRFHPYYRAFGDTQLQIASTLLFRPERLVSYLSDPARVRYLLFLFVPVGFVPLLGASTLLVALPRLALNLLSGWEVHYSQAFWYEFCITPFLFVGVIHGLARLKRWGGKKWTAVVGAGAVYVLSGCLLSAKFWGPNPLREIAQLKVTDHHQLARKVFELISADASVAAQSNLVAHLAHRKRLSVLPEVNDAGYVVFDVFNPNRGPRPEVFQETLQRAFNSPDYGLVFCQNGYFLFLRGADRGQNVSTLAFVTDPQIQYPMRVVLGDSVAFLGFDLSQKVVTSGEQVYLTTYWQCLKPVPHPYLLLTAYPGSWRLNDFAHGLYPTAKWHPGEVIKDEQAIVLPVLPDGEDYEIALGLWYDQGKPELNSPEQLLGHDVIRIVNIEAKAGQYSFRPIGVAP